MIPFLSQSLHLRAILRLCGYSPHKPSLVAPPLFSHASVDFLIRGISVECLKSPQCQCIIMLHSPSFSPHPALGLTWPSLTCAALCLCPALPSFLLLSPLWWREPSQKKSAGLMGFKIHQINLFTASRALVYNVFVLESIIGWHKWWWWGSHVMIGAWSNNEQIYSQPISTSLQRHLWTRPCSISGHQSPPWAELGRDWWLLQRRAHLSPQPWENYKKLRMQLRNGYGSVLLQTNDHYCVSISLTLSSIPIKMKMVFARR